MKKILSALILVAIFSGISFSLSAQYLTGIGPTLGMYGRGVTVIQYFAPKDRGAADFLITSQYKGVMFTGLYEIHNPNHNERIELANVGFFAGLGGHAGVVDRTQYNNVPGADKKRIFVIGVDVIAGAEWKLPRVPLLLSVNAKPYLDLNQMKHQPDFFDAAITLRLLF